MLDDRARRRRRCPRSLAGDRELGRGLRGEGVADHRDRRRPVAPVEAGELQDGVMDSLALSQTQEDGPGIVLVEQRGRALRRGVQGARGPASAAAAAPGRVTSIARTGVAGSGPLPAGEEVAVLAGPDLIDLAARRRARTRGSRRGPEPGQRARSPIIPERGTSGSCSWSRPQACRLTSLRMSTASRNSGR